MRRSRTQPLWPWIYIPRSKRVIRIFVAFMISVLVLQNYVSLTSVMRPSLHLVGTLEESQLESNYPLPYLEQIQKDLKPFSKITLDMIHKSSKLNRTFRVQYINQTLYSYPPILLDEEDTMNTQRMFMFNLRISRFVRLLADTVRRFKTSDFDMVINLQDEARACDKNIDLTIFSFQKYHPCRDILIPCAIAGLGTSEFDKELNEISKISENYLWTQKSDKIIWRGMASGGPGPWNKTTYHMMARYRIFVECEKEELKNVCDVGLSFQKGVMIDDPRIILRDKIPFDDWMNYKYELVVDGNGSPAKRIDRQLAHNSLLLMQETEHFQMYTKYLKPYAHYVPLLKNISDLGRAYQWASENEDRVLKIIQAANDFAHDYLNRESILYYTHVLLKTYSSALRFKPQLESGSSIVMMNETKSYDSS